MPFTAYHLTAAGDVRLRPDERGVQEALQSGEGTLWVDVFGTTPEDGDFLSRVFKFHQLAVEDCVDAGFHPVKVDEYEDHVFIVVHGINYAVESHLVETAELGIFVGRNYVVSSHNYPLSSVDAVAHAVEVDGRPMRRGPALLAHTIIDALIANMRPTQERMSEVADDIEEEAIRRPAQETIEVILALKRSTLRLQRILTPQRDIMTRLGRGEYAVIGEDAWPFFRDAYDAVVRLGDGNYIVRERADNALATYLTSISLRQNETMKALAIVASIFMPLTLLAGVYGMNFQNMPELGWSWGYFAVLAVMATAGLGALWWFWARQWITVGRARRLPRRMFAVRPGKLLRRPTHTEDVTQSER